MPSTLKPDHLLDLAFVADPVISLDGHLAAACVTRIEINEGPPSYRTVLYLFELEAGVGGPFTAGRERDTSPRFSPSGAHLAFLSVAHPDAKPQLYLIPTGGGEAVRVTHLPAGVESFAWHPNSESIFLISAGNWSDEAKGPRTITRRAYKRDGKGLLRDTPAAIYRLDRRSRSLKLLYQPAFELEHLVVAPDGSSLYFTGALSEEEADIGRTHIQRLDLGSGKVVGVTPVPLHLKGLSVHPSGAGIAYLSPIDPENSASPVGLFYLPTGSSKARLLTGDTDATQSVGGDSRYGAYPNVPHWLDEERLLFNLNRAGRSNLADVTLNGEIRAWGDAAAATTSFAAGASKVVCTVETTTQPGELYLIREGGEPTALTAVNAEFTAAHVLNDPRGPILAGESGPAYWQLEPHEPREDRALVVQVHGGPHTNYGYGFYLEFHILAAAGYTVVYGNPRGGSSFGADFATTILGRYGTVDADDVLTIARHARGAFGGEVVPVHLTGGSYGGFMTNWLVGRTDEFRSAVTQRSICNWLSFYGTSDIGPYFTERELCGDPWSKTELLWSQSPIRHVANVVTPILILHSEEDHRCPIEQAEQWFTALKRIGKAATKLLRFPNEGHELSRSGRPDRRVARLEAILEWFDEHGR